MAVLKTLKYRYSLHAAAECEHEQKEGEEIPDVVLYVVG